MNRHNKNEWTKVLLGAYEFLPAAVKAAKAEAQSLALSGYDFNGDIVELVSKVIDCNKRAENYVNAFVLIGEGLKRIGAEKALLLKDVFVGRMTLCEHASRMGLSKSGMRRRAREALCSFECACKMQGYGEEWYNSRFGKDMLFDKIREKVNARNPAI